MQPPPWFEQCLSLHPMALVCVCACVNASQLRKSQEQDHRRRTATGGGEKTVQATAHAHNQRHSHPAAILTHRTHTMTTNTEVSYPPVASEGLKRTDYNTLSYGIALHDMSISWLTFFPFNSVEPG